MEDSRSPRRISDARRGPAGAAPEREGTRLALLGGFSLTMDGEPVTLPPASQRVLAFVAVCCRGAVPRALIAGTLWPEATERCAHASLRSALSRLRHTGLAALDTSPSAVRLAAGVRVDLHAAHALALNVLDGGPHAVQDKGIGAQAVIDLSADLLPGWYEDWALQEADAWRQLRTHALERLATDFIAARRFGEAVTAAGAAVRADPLRESGQMTLIRAHLAEGNAAQARQDFVRFARRLRAETGLRPSLRLRALVAGHGADGGPVAGWR